MEREKPRNRFIMRKRDVVFGTFMAAAFSAGFQNTGAKAPSKPEVYPESMFRPVIIYNNSEEPSPTITAYDNLVVESPSPSALSEEEQKQLEIKEEQNQIINIMQAHPELFRKKYIQDVKMYYPIYKAVSGKFNIPWYLLFTVHEAETGASAGERGFRQDSYYKGAMQIDPNFWPDSYVNEASTGLEELGNLPQRRGDDWRQIAAAGNILSDNIKKYMDLGEDKAVLNALLLYSADGEARKRYGLYETYKEIFQTQ